MPFGVNVECLGRGGYRRTAGGGVCRWHTSTADRAEGETGGPCAEEWGVQRGAGDPGGLRLGLGLPVGGVDEV